MPRKPKFLVAGFTLLLAFGFLGFQAFSSASTYYLTVSELKALGDKAYAERAIRLTGTVKADSISRENNGRLLRFLLTDGTESVPVSYTGVVPDTFKPDADVVVEGKYFASGAFEATALLARCPSKYDAD
ncbi:MAG: cytochrome c maturation protein CcmE [Chloroflexi bacterium]|nr:cytochrome c maturation protein CcmE [Chloroflexota bacterium]